MERKAAPVRARARARAPRVAKGSGKAPAKKKKAAPAAAAAAAAAAAGLDGAFSDDSDPGDPETGYPTREPGPLCQPQREDLVEIGALMNQALGACGRASVANPAAAEAPAAAKVPEVPEAANEPVAEFYGLGRDCHPDTVLERCCVQGDTDGLARLRERLYDHRLYPAVEGLVRARLQAVKTSAKRRRAQISFDARFIEALLSAGAQRWGSERVSAEQTLTIFSLGEGFFVGFTLEEGGGGAAQKLVYNYVYLPSAAQICAVTRPSGLAAAARSTSA